jgi:hypothetical protein
MDPGWDKKFTSTLSAYGLTFDQARFVVGLVVEERQNADRQGYIRGFNSGFEACLNKKEREKK